MRRIKPPHVASVASTIPTPLWAHLYGSAARCKPKLTPENSGVGTSVSGPLLEPFELLAIIDIRACANSFASRTRRSNWSPEKRSSSIANSGSLQCVLRAEKLLDPSAASSANRLIGCKWFGGGIGEGFNPVSRIARQPLSIETVERRVHETYVPQAKPPAIPNPRTRRR
jgi:hypothetical protein